MIKLVNFDSLVEVIKKKVMEVPAEHLSALGIKDMGQIYETLRLIEPLVNKEDQASLLAEKLSRIDIPNNVEFLLGCRQEMNNFLKPYGLDFMFPVNNIAANVVVLDDLTFMEVNTDILYLTSDAEVREVIRHELVHYDQLKTGRLSTENGHQAWTVPDEEFSVVTREDTIKRTSLGTNLKEYLKYELRKPWEMEAYLSSKHGHKFVRSVIGEEALDEVYSRIPNSLSYLEEFRH